jgi:hypothetical protein
MLGSRRVDSVSHFFMATATECFGQPDYQIKAFLVPFQRLLPSLFLGLNFFPKK